MTLLWPRFSPWVVLRLEQVCQGFHPRKDEQTSAKVRVQLELFQLKNGNKLFRQA